MLRPIEAGPREGAHGSRPWSVPARRSAAGTSPGVRLVLAAIVLAGAALRLLAARGELWLDEIWSLNLVAPLRSAGAVVWGISHDNNHVLNSLWLYAAGPGHAAMLYRLPAVLFGSLSVLVAARIGLRRDAGTGVAAALLAAIGTVWVTYGSEARGYAGLILAILIAIDGTEQAVAARRDPGTHANQGAGARWRLAAAAGFGALSHLTMLSALAVLGVAAAVRLGRPGRPPAAVAADLLWLFWPAGLMLLPALAALFAGILVCDGFTMGGVTPFSPEHIIAGYGGLLRLTAGLPGAVPAWAALAVIGGGALAAARCGLIPQERWPLLAAGLLVLPGMMAAARLPNLQFPRYFLVCGVILLLCLADAVGALWRRGGAGRWLGVALLGSVLAGQGPSLGALLVLGRGAPTQALAHMAEAGGARYASNAPFATRTAIGYAAPGLGLSLTEGDTRDCANAAPDWIIESSETDGAPAAASVDVGPPACRRRYGLDAVYPASVLSGLGWRLYRLGPSQGGE